MSGKHNWFQKADDASAINVQDVTKTTNREDRSKQNIFVRNVVSKEGEKCGTAMIPSS